MFNPRVGCAVMICSNLVHNPEGLRALCPQGSSGRQPWDGGRNPFGVGAPFAVLPQGSRGRQPWDGRRNPFGVGAPFAGLPRVAADGNPGLDDATPSGLGPLLRSYPG